MQVYIRATAILGGATMHRVSILVGEYRGAFKTRVDGKHDIALGKLQEWLGAWRKDHPPIVVTVEAGSVRAD